MQYPLILWSFFGFWFGSRRTKKWDYEIKNEDEKDENKTIYPV